MKTLLNSYKAFKTLQFRNADNGSLFNQLVTNSLSSPIYDNYLFFKLGTTRGSFSTLRRYILTLYQLGKRALASILSGNLQAFPLPFKRPSEEESDLLIEFTSLDCEIYNARHEYDDLLEFGAYIPSQPEIREPFI
jgi:hypothetical protein